jgi:hypothetical protein
VSSSTEGLLPTPSTGSRARPRPSSRLSRTFFGCQRCQHSGARDVSFCKVGSVRCGDDTPNGKMVFPFAIVPSVLESPTRRFGASFILTQTYVCAWHYVPFWIRFHYPGYIRSRPVQKEITGAWKFPMSGRFAGYALAPPCPRTAPVGAGPRPLHCALSES